MLAVLATRRSEMTDYDTINKLTSPENLTYAIIATTGAFVLSVGAFFYTEYKKFKKIAENKIKKNLEESLKENKMVDMNCDYISNDWDCQSPKLDGAESKCICSNYKSCFLFPPAELKNIIKPEEESNLEKEANGI